LIILASLAHSSHSGEGCLSGETTGLRLTLSELIYYIEMLRNVNDNRLGSRVICVPNDRDAIFQRNHIEARPQKRKFFTENKTQTPDFNSSLDVLHTIYIPNGDNKIYYPYPKNCERLQETYNETDWTTFLNYTKN
jgi:hypothetical protein